MVTPEVVGYFDPGGIAGLSGEREARRRDPIALAVGLCLVTSITTANKRTLLDS